MAGRGAVSTRRLTDVACRKAQGPAKLYDGNGLYLQVDTTGARRWVQRIMILSRRHELGLGSYSFVTLAQARESAEANRRLARTGKDPVMEVKGRATSFQQAAEEWFAMKAPTLSNAKAT